VIVSVSKEEVMGGYAVLCLDRGEVKVIATFRHLSYANRFASQRQHDSEELGFNFTFYVKELEG
jgi:hypothetical protein